jgi:hypothetical protein
MDEVIGTIYQTTNVRKEPKVIDNPTNVVRKLTKGKAFAGVTVMNGAEKWIKLEIVDGVTVTDEQYVASWVVNSTVVVTTPPTEEPPVSDPFVKAQLLNKDGVVVEEYTMVKL